MSKAMSLWRCSTDTADTSIGCRSCTSTHLAREAAILFSGAHRPLVGTTSGRVGRRRRGREGARPLVPLRGRQWPGVSKPGPRSHCGQGGSGGITHAPSECAARGEDRGHIMWQWVRGRRAGARLARERVDARPQLGRGGEPRHPADERLRPRGGLVQRGVGDDGAARAVEREVRQALRTADGRTDGGRERQRSGGSGGVDRWAAGLRGGPTRTVRSAK